MQNGCNNIRVDANLSFFLFLSLCTTCFECVKYVSARKVRILQDVCSRNYFFRLVFNTVACSTT